MAGRRGGANREAILGAAYEAIATLGYAGATTAEICRRARVSSGTFFHYFPTKEDVLLALLVGRKPVQDPTFTAIIDEAIAEANDPLLPSFVQEVSTRSALPRVHAVLAEQTADRRTRLRIAVEAERRAGRVRADLDDDALADRVEMVISGYEVMLAAGTEPSVAVVALRELLVDGLNWCR